MAVVVVDPGWLTGADEDGVVGTVVVLDDEVTVAVSAWRTASNSRRSDRCDFASWRPVPHS